MRSGEKKMNAALERFFRRTVLVFIDMMLCCFSALAATYIVTNGLALVVQHPSFLIGVVVLQVAFLGLFKIYSIRLIDSSLELAVRGQGALTLSGLLILIVIMVNLRDLSLSLRLFIPYLASASLLILGYRIVLPGLVLLSRQR